MVDDAHGVGVRGEQGRGSCWQQGVRPELLVATFGKAFGVSGAAVLCDEATAEYLLQFARHLIYSTAMPPAQACALQAALACIREGDELRARLQDNIRRFRQGAAPLALTLTDSDTAIQPLLVGDNARARSGDPPARVRTVGERHSPADGAAGRRAATHYPDGGASAAGYRSPAGGAE
jgi:8-amino-7-oxononanoate synthase